jgi:nascent polypeptide-associated complex subunit alpha
MAYKALRSVKGVPTGREAMRMMQKMGMDMKEIANVRQVVIKTAEKQIVIDDPTVTTITMQGQTMFQVAGGTVVEEAYKEEVEQALPISEDDVRLVAEQARVSVEEARKALIESRGDLAQAILALKAKSS